MKKVILLYILMAFSTLNLLAQTVPQAINFEAIARDNSGNPIGGGSLIVQFSILNNGTPIYSEIHVNVPVSPKGLFNAPIGKGTATLGTFAQIDWAASGMKTIKVTINNNLESETTLQSVPYALRAASAATADKINLNYGEGLTYNAATNTLSNTRLAQTLSLANGLLTISGGNSVALPTPITYTSGDGIAIANNAITNTKPSKWLSGSNGIHNLGNVGIGREASADRKLTIEGDLLIQNVIVPDNKALLTSLAWSLNYKGPQKAYAYAFDDSLGVMGTQGLNGAYLQFSRLSGYKNNPYVALTNETQSTGVPKVGILIDQNGKGAIHINENGFRKAGFYYDNFSGWTAFASVKSFREPHPLQPEKEIWYACIEGREAAIYVRGTAKLVNGIAKIDFPEDFALMALPEGMTAMTTPNSADSKGMAVVRKTTSGIEVQELGGGQGNYTFDWEVKAVRKGYENFKVVRDRMKGDAVDMSERKENPNK
jgi:hypothetical protein